MGGPPVFTHTGFVNVVAPEYARALVKNIEMLRGIGINTTALSPAELRDLQPFANVDDLGAAAYEPDSGYASPVDVVEGFGRRARELGAAVRPWTAVTRVLRREGRVVGVETAGGEIHAGAVVVAAGAWAPRLCHEMGLTLPARPKAIDTVAVARPPELARGHMVFIDNAQGSYFRPEAGGLTLVGRAVPGVGRESRHARHGAAAARGGRGRAASSPTAFRSWKAPLSPAAIAPSTVIAVTATPSWDRWTASTASTLPPRSAAPASRSRLRWASAWRSSSPTARAKTVDITAFGLRRFAEGRPLEGPHPYAQRLDHADSPRLS